MQQSSQNLLIRFADPDTQLKADSILKTALGEDYIIALNLAPATPHWLSMLGGAPMKLGLDLRGGVHFLLDIDVNSVVKQRTEGSVRNISGALREAEIRYVDIQRQRDNGIYIQFRDTQQLEAAYSVIAKQFPEFTLTKQTQANTFALKGVISEQAFNNIRQQAVDQTLNTLRNRVNELGVAEPLIQQQGPDRVAVDLPGVQDTARAKDILGGTATVEFRLQDLEHDPRDAMNGMVPIGSKLYDYENHPLLLKDQVILSGHSITDAGASFDEEGRPSVNIRLGGGGENYFSRVTRDNVGKPLATVYQEIKVENKIINGVPQKVTKKVEKVINVAIIRSALGASFQIMGLPDPLQARNLALLLRAGSLPAPISIAEERLVGPSLGSENIHKGVLSIEVGFAIVVIFMALYYSRFGLIANVALGCNLVLLVALMSVLGMTLTLPGIAGIVLNVGMAVDANVLIFERIREELRNGVSPHASIHAGYERALSTIIDANVTTLIVALVLFGIGTGAVKGFAVTLTLGLMTSMLTSIVFTRGMVNAAFGRRSMKSLPIGI